MKLCQYTEKKVKKVVLKKFKSKNLTKKKTKNYFNNFTYFCK